MIKDLTGTGNTEQTADFVVIGAGTVGLPVAVELARRLGKHVVVLESGGRKQEDDTHPLNEVVQLSATYNGAEHGRFRGLGGTSSRWGGALIPFQPSDLDASLWPFAMAELEPFISQVEAIFGLEQGPYEDTGFPLPLGADFTARLAKWPPFRHRNVYSLLADDCETLPNLDVWLNANVTEIQSFGTDAPVQVIARSAAGDRVSIRAERLIVAAGAIETTRLALLIDRQNDGLISRRTDALGRYFSDHLSVPVARIDVRRKSRLNRIIGFRFGANGTMRNIRFELSNETALRESLPPSFTHIAFETHAPGGFDALREGFRYLQMRRAPPVSVITGLIANAPWLLRAIWWRFFERRLLLPSSATLHAHLVTEQVPSFDNRISLSDSRSDAYGVPMAEIDWRVTVEDIDNLHASVDAAETMWTSPGFAELGEWRRRDRESVGLELAGGGGIFHPTGSTRMASAPVDGVVDGELKLFGQPRIQLLSTSVLPTGGGANPTMMLLLLGMRCVEKHAASAR